MEYRSSEEVARMFKVFKLRTDKGQKTRRLWGQEFNIVENGLGEEQVVNFVNNLMVELEAAQRAATARSAGAEAEAENETVRIIDPAKDKAEEVEGRAEISEVEQGVPQEQPDGKETKHNLLEQDRQALYVGEVELAIDKPVDPKMVSILFTYLQTMPDIKLVHTSGSWDRGTTLTVMLDKPVPLIGLIAAKIPEAEIVPELIERNGNGKGKQSLPLGGKKSVRKIRLAPRKG